MKLREIAKLTASAIEEGSPDQEISGAAGLDIAGEGEITFLANPKYTPKMNKTKATAIFLNDGVKIGRDDIAVLRTKDAYVAYTVALRAFHPTPPIKAGIHPSAVIDPSATVSSNCEIGQTL